MTTDHRPRRDPWQGHAMSATVQTTAPMLLSEQAYDDVRAVTDQTGDDVREISDATARTIAGWFASSGPHGRALASLSTGRPVELDELTDDIATARREHADHLLPIDGRALDCLATWAIQTSTADQPGSYEQSVAEGRETIAHATGYSRGVADTLAAVKAEGYPEAAERARARMTPR
jgi:hypothetical protein